MKKKPTAVEQLQNLADFIAEDIMATSDDEILAEMTPDDLAKVEASRQTILALIERKRDEMARDRL